MASLAKAQCGGEMEEGERERDKLQTRMRRIDVAGGRAASILRMLETSSWPRDDGIWMDGR